MIKSHPLFLRYALCAMLFALISIPAIAQNHSVKYTLTKDDESFLDTLEHYTFKFFWTEVNKDNGLVKDRSSADSPASIAATGFGISAWAIGAERGWIKREEAAAVTLNLLNFLMHSEQSDKTITTGYRGFYYHFLNMKTGLREWNCELSTIDTALLLAGIRFAAQYYNKNNNAEKKIRALSDALTHRVQWDWMLMKNNGRFTNSISMGWSPEKNDNFIGWIGYNEALILYIIAAGTNYSYTALSYNQWLKYYEWKEPYKGLGHVIFPPLFGHQFSHMFVDFRGIADKYMRDKGIDYFENSRRATLTQHHYAIDNPLGWKGYDSLTWGLTACDGPGQKYNSGQYKFNDYAARGTSGPQLIHDDDGTIAPSAAGGSIVFAPEIVISTLKNIKEKYGAGGLWGKYGLVDAFNLTANWFDKDYLGIDQGPILIMIENLRTGLIWNYTMKDPVIKSGLKKLGFKKIHKIN